MGKMSKPGKADSRGRLSTHELLTNAVSLSDVDATYCKCCEEHKFNKILDQHF